MTFTIGSLFDGSGGFPLAGTLCGIEPRWASEVEPYPIAVTRSRFPDMKHLGNISKVNGAEIEPVDVITFGSPCQDLSVAGRQAGLKHESNGDTETTRSGLFMEAVRIIKEMRRATNDQYPKFAVWENVPGAFSSNKGEDFRTVLQEIIQVVEPEAPAVPAPEKGGWPYADVLMGDGWSIAYRTFDAQHWGVPQRRRRIYLVADFTGGRAGKVLFEREGLRGYLAESGTSWEGAAAEAEEGAGGADEVGATCYGICSYDSNSMKSGNPHSGIYEAETSRTIDLNGGNPVCNQGGIAVVEPANVYILDNIGGQGERGWSGDISPTLKASHYKFPPCVTSQSAGFSTEHSAKSRSIGYQEETAPTLRAGVTPACVYSVENHPNDSRVNIDDSGTVQTLTSRMGTGGGNVPMVMEPFCKGSRGRFKGDAATWKPAEVSNTLNTFDTGEARANELVVAFAQNQREEVRDLDGKAVTLNAQPGTHQQTFVIEQKPVFCLQGNGIDRADTAGCNGKGWREDQSYTLNTIDRPAVVYALDRSFFNQGRNALYMPQLYEDGTNPTLLAKGPSAVAYEGGTYTASKASFFMRGAHERADCLVATDYKDPPIINDRAEGRYIVRRLTPTECARLQGFPDWWAYVEPKDDLTDEERRFWQDVRNTHAEINGKTVKEYTKEQMLTWFNKLHSDSAEYKMWGNGVALPPTLYVMQGIAEALRDRAA